MRRLRDGLIALLLVPAACGVGPAQVPPAFAENRQAVPLDAKRARGYLEALCAIGPRVSGSPGMARQQELLTKHFQACGAKVTRQDFKIRARSRPAEEVAMANLVASFRPELKTRVIFCCHYDTRPAAHDEPDPAAWRKPFLSANDGTAGAALLQELAHHLAAFPTEVGVDLVLFDGEEYILDPSVPVDRGGDAYFHGSRHFAQKYQIRKAQGGPTYRAAILLDLCCAANARLAVEGHSWQFAPQLVDEVWGVAKSLGAKSFVYEAGFRRASDVMDDHLALNEAGIPAVDVIDFDYPHWHRLSDTADKISDAQVVEVGQVLLAWLKGVKAKP